MRKQTQKRVSAGFVNVEVGLDAPWSVQPHRWKNFIIFPLQFAAQGPLIVTILGDI